MKLVKHGQEALQADKVGIDLFADTIGRTLGPRGRHVIIDTNPHDPNQLLITNDGVTVAHELEGADEFAQVGAKLAREVASKTEDVAGDGTTTATVLFRAIVHEGMKALVTGVDPVALRRGIEKAAKAAVEAVEKGKTDVDDLESLQAVATISSRDPELGKIIAKLVKEVGPDGLITLDASEELETTSELTEGLELRGGFTTPFFITNPNRPESVLDKVPVFVTNHSLTNALEVVRLMEVAAAEGHKQAVVIANSIEGEALLTCIINWREQKFRLLPLRVVSHGSIGEDAVRDVAAVTGGTFYAKEEGNRLPTNMDDRPFESSHFGLAGRVIATKDKVTILDGEGDKDARIIEIEAKLPSLKDYEKESAKERIAKMRSGVGRIAIGGLTETDRTERMKRVEDAVNSTKAALESGVVAGGGAALYRAADSYIETDKEDEGIGVLAVLKACTTPINLMAENAGMHLDKSELDLIRENNELTFDFDSGEIVTAMEAGIIDPCKTVTAALKHAANQAALFLTSESTVVIKQEGK